MGDSNDVFEVEKILNHKVSKGVTLYKLKWKGFPISECTWERESNLDCPELLNQYWNSLKSSKKAPESPNTKTLSPQNKKLMPEKQTKIGFLRNEPSNIATQKKIDTSSLSLIPQKEKDDIEKNKKELLDKEKIDGKKKKVVQSQIDKLMNSLRNAGNQQKLEKEKKDVVSQNLNDDCEILAAAKNPKNSSVLYLVKQLKDGEIITKVVTSEYARNNLSQPLINFFLNNLKITKPI